MEDGGQSETGFKKRAARVLHLAETPDGTRIYQNGENGEQRSLVRRKQKRNAARLGPSLRSE